jgi:hypothetical protein
MTHLLRRPTLALSLVLFTVGFSPLAQTITPAQNPGGGGPTPGCGGACVAATIAPTPAQNPGGGGPTPGCGGACVVAVH